MQWYHRSVSKRLTSKQSFAKWFRIQIYELVSLTFDLPNSIFSMAVITQMTTLNSRVPFLHFMDGFRTSHEVNKINLVSDEELKRLIPFDKVEEHRQRALSPLHPNQRGTAQAPDVFMQLVESSNRHYQAVSTIVAFHHSNLLCSHKTLISLHPSKGTFFVSSSFEGLCCSSWKRVQTI